MKKAEVVFLQDLTKWQKIEREAGKKREEGGRVDTREVIQRQQNQSSETNLLDLSLRDIHIKRRERMDDSPASESQPVSNHVLRRRLCLQVPRVQLIRLVHSDLSLLGVHLPKQNQIEEDEASSSSDICRGALLCRQFL